ncbi:helix-turn-helix domain-containing protein [Streptomyces sp. BSE6.1]|uniref:helix-turn-helix domain-containing protein n=1 Tax=Streptomyces sp. BSE6.1 TaxID=2605730 RepID=UPI001F212045|nr:helix-turn-helix domain-containing protein [Streptomyces sp. BSE6.1]
MTYGNRIERGPMAGDRFTQLSNALFRDPRISLKAKGLFGLISTHRDGFGLSIRSIARNIKESKDAVGTGLKELEEFGYLERIAQHEKGKFAGYVYRITDMPAHLYDLFGDDAPQLPSRSRDAEPTPGPRPDIPDTAPRPENPDTAQRPENPDTGNPDPDQPDPYDPHTKKINSKNTKSQNTSGKNAAAPPDDTGLFAVAEDLPTADAVGDDEQPAENVTAQTIVGEWLDRCPKRPPNRITGQVAKAVKELLGEGIDPDDVRRGMSAWMHSGKTGPSLIPGFVHEVMNAPTSGALIPGGHVVPFARRPSTTDQRVQEALAAGRRLQALADAKRQGAEP